MSTKRTRYRNRGKRKAARREQRRLVADFIHFLRTTPRETLEGMLKDWRRMPDEIVEGGTCMTQIP